MREFEWNLERILFKYVRSLSTIGFLENWVFSIPNSTREKTVASPSECLLEIFENFVSDRIFQSLNFY